MRLRNLTPWAAAVLSAVLLEFPFPIAGPMPPWRGLFAFIGLVPLVCAVLALTESPRPLRRAFLIGYLCGVLWYAGNCYWIYDTMRIHGGLPPVGAVALLLGFSLVLGAYFGLFALGLKFLSYRIRLGLVTLAAPFLWVALDLAASRITSVPWDQLGYSQVDNAMLTHLAPVTGVYGITFFVVAVNMVGAAAVLRIWKHAYIRAGLLIVAICVASSLRPLQPVPTASAVLYQPNLDVDSGGVWPQPVWDRQIAQFTNFATQTCAASIGGIPETGAPSLAPQCPQPPAHPDLVAWPESPAPFFEDEDQFRNAIKQVAQTAHSPVIVGGVGMGQSAEGADFYNSAMVFDAEGAPQGRYDKIHLVPYGEFVPYRGFFFFAKKLTHKVGETSRGTARRTFLIADAQGNTHRYGIFICYEAVFADEVRQFAKNGADVFVNISDDGWYGDTSAPWQHLNMARMRAIENRRWILRDTNNGVTAVIDPFGTVRQSIPRHSVGALAAQYGFNSETTFYTRHGDVFAWLCAILSIGLVAWTLNPRSELRVQIKSGLKEQK